ncbi:AAA family ATPase [Paraburkholderia sp. JPY419]|uniref:AAA family ATPase n=1 Tax=Paraburkholderia sp. JPY419 TaxID=667660 RepID=UPI003D1B3BB7
MSEASNTALGGAASIVEHFSIEGLYGYRTVTLTSQYAATILIARNGAGKTTLLGALDAFLKGEFYRLASLHFTSIKCKLRDVKSVLEISRDDVRAIASTPANERLHKLAAGINSSPSELYDFINSDYIKRLSSGDYVRYGENDVYDKLIRFFRHDSDKIVNAATAIISSIEESHPNIAHIRKVLNDTFAGMEIVYLPTYRRIELPLPSENSDRGSQFGRRKSVSEILNIPRTGIYSGDIQFGLADISERLAWLNERLVGEANRGYSKISADIINELIAGELDRDDFDVVERPSKESLRLFFSRLKSARRNFFSETAMPTVDRIYDSDISSESNKFLTYFLGKLNQVIKATREIDLMVDNFVLSCNRYLSGEDPSTDIENNKNKVQKHRTGDGKILTVDRKALAVKVESVSPRRKISIESLSSGEKQMISLFAKLYLYPGNKIILIDEPELSMSIDWQRKILLDVLAAPSCSQVIAITHSPFIFDNQLEPFAKPLSVKVDPNARSDDPTDNEDDSND